MKEDEGGVWKRTLFTCYMLKKKNLLLCNIRSEGSADDLFIPGSACLGEPTGAPSLQGYRLKTFICQP